MSVSVRGQFRRSVHLERDFYGEGAHEGYLVTVKAREVIARVAEALEAPVAQRAWSITGPYGGGKSAFALFLAHLLREEREGDDSGGSAIGRLAGTGEALAAQFDEVRGGVFCPVLVVGSREPLVPALLRGLAEGLDAFRASYARRRGKPSREVRALRDELEAAAEAARQLVEGGAGDPSAEGGGAEDQRVSEAELLALVERAARAVHACTGGGLVLVVDELGKMLEYAALYPERSDLFALQRLAERASRAGQGEGGEAPILLFTILHQAFERYAGRLGSVQRDEWRKVQGRFEDVAFVEPVSETLRLLAEAVVVEDPCSLPTHGDALVGAIVKAAELGPHADEEAVCALLRDALPLHPAVALLVGPLFRRLAQNERSLFAFLASGERNGFLEVVARGARGEADLFGATEPLALYRLDHLYDYLIANLGATLFSERMEKLWAETEAALSAVRDRDPLAARLVKHVAMLGFAGGLAGLEPTAETLAATADAPPDRVEATLGALRKARVIAYRPFGETYHVWQGSDFDLQERLREAREQVPLRTPLASLLSRTMPPTPLVARRHSYRTGTTRVFEVVYASDQDWPAVVAASHSRADGRVVYVLPEHDEIDGIVEALRAGVDDSLTLVAVPDGVAALREAVRDLACLDWVRKNTPELKSDPVARREVAEQRSAIAAEVDRRLSALLVADDEGKNPCTWVYEGGTFRLESERALQRRLSEVCDAVYPHAPEVWNELLNRKKPSSSAVRGLKLLLQAMSDHSGEARLGIEGTPAEFGMYASVLRETGMHQLANDDPTRGEATERESQKDGAAPTGQWHFVRPNETERPGCAAVWDRIGEVLRSSGGHPVPLRDVFDALSAPPYGVREGLIPVFLFAFVQSRADEIAFYESGSFVRELTFETTERLLKSQEKGQDTFEIQWVEIDGARADVLSTLGPLLGLSGSVRKPLPVAIRILRRVHELPPFVRRTGDLSETALTVRGALERAKDPTRLVFEDLPEACGAGSFLTDAEPEDARLRRYAEGLQEALRELGGAYDALLASIQDRIAHAFRLRASDAEGRRHELAERARALIPVAADLRLKAFLVRASDEILDTRAWTESVAALVAKQPPAQWGDEERARFRVGLQEIARTFDNLEPLALDLAADEAHGSSGESSRAQESALVDEIPRGASDTPSEVALAQRSEAGNRVRRVRLLVKTLNEDEQDGVIHVHPEDDAIIGELHDALAGFLNECDVHPDAKLAALGRLATALLRERAADTERLPAADEPASSERITSTNTPPSLDTESSNA